MFENVDGRLTDGRQTTGAGPGIIGILWAYPRVFGSGELKRVTTYGLAYKISRILKFSTCLPGQITSL